MATRHFDPAHEREVLAGDTGFNRVFRRKLSDSRAVGGLASSAHAFLNDAVDCCLVGFDEPADQLLKKAAEWVQVAIATDEKPERYFPHGTEASRFKTLALCNWLLLNSFA